jgi:hypothetical protein
VMAMVGTVPGRRRGEGMNVRVMAARALKSGLDMVGFLLISFRWLNIVLLFLRSCRLPVHNNRAGEFFQRNTDEIVLSGGEGKLRGEKKQKTPA